MFSSSPPLLNISFPDGLNHIFTASDVVQGGVSVRLETEDKGTQFKLDRVVAKLRVVQISTYYTRRANGAGHAGVGNRAGGSHVDSRTETVQLYGEDRLLWTAASQPLPPSLASSPGQPATTIQIPFSFQLPPMQMNLPPSFEGGTRSGSAVGNQVGRIMYFLKFTGAKPGTFSRDEKYTLPFLYHPPSLVNEHDLPGLLFPRQLVPPNGKNDLPVDPPRAPTAQDGWITMAVEKDYREKLFGKKNRVIVKLTTPSISAYPRTIPIPYHLSITVLAHASHTTSSDTPPDIILPPPSDLKILLVRHVTTRARGATQSFNQTVGLLTDLKNESRVWRLPPVLRDLAGGGRRWGAEVVAVGEMAVGGAAGPSFGAGMTRGLLTCDYSIELDLPLKGPMNDLEVPAFMGLVISSNVHPGQQQYWHQQQQQQQQLGSSLGVDVPPGYWDVTDGDLGDEK